MISLNGGYAMIKYNSTQEELQIAYRSKKPVLCYDENRRAHWAVIEETATESVDEETQEPITIYEYSYRLIDEASGGATLDNIVDSKGNKRFIEGDGTPATVTGFTPTYCKWSLSGTHLMCVLAGSLMNTTVFPANTSIVTFELPEYILNKIYPVWDDNIAFIDINTIYGGGTTKTYKVILKKNNNSISLDTYISTTISNESTFRIQVDLLIDADYE